ncbi:MAG TPA: S8 family serine peptidase, partial [Actinomycetota bacterium]|nr:S8 family serine peptidase [Actinomycetota bacterium]
MKRLKVALVLLVALLAAPALAGASAQPAEQARVHPNLLPLLTQGEARIPVIIRFASTPTVEDKKMLIKSGFLGPFVRFGIVPALQTVGSADAIEEVLGKPRVRYIEHDAVIPWAMDRAVQVTRASDVWEADYVRDDQALKGITGKGVGIAVVDSGVDATHPDLLHHSIANRLGLPAKTVANLKLVGRDSVGLYATPPAQLGLGEFLEANVLGIDMPDTDNTGGHGTHVAGITSGNGEASGGDYKGAAPGANLIGFGAGETLVISASLAAFDWIHRSFEEGNPHNIRVVNNSWGGAGEWNPESAITQGAQQLVRDGIAVVFAAGNSGGNGSTLQSSTWGNIPEVIQVANYYDRSGWAHWSSSRGLRSREDTWPDVSAPGTQIIATQATGRPVTAVCMQDVVVDEMLDENGEASLDDDAEPTVISAPIPQPVEGTVPAPAGPIFEEEDVIVGNYASCTGTSMASPHVAGVIALILEANPNLNPSQVKDILRETANMPLDRTYKGDGYAIGKGVVDAAEAVAVALKMYEGLSLRDAVRLAHADSSPSAELNSTDQQNVDIQKPADGESLGGSTVTVSGRFNNGPLTDQSIPLHPNLGSEPTDPYARPEPATRPGTSFFGTDFEGDNSGWQIVQKGTGPGLLTNWGEIDHSGPTGGLSWAGTHSGSKMFYAGLWPLADQNSGLTYTDFANTSLISPVIDLTDAKAAALSYWRAGMSESGIDFLRVFVAPDGTQDWQKVDEISGDFVFSGRTGSWEEKIVSLDLFVDQKVRLRFEFTSRFSSPLATNLVGWYIDDVTVLGEEGEVGPAIIRPTLSADPDFGVGSLASNLIYSVGSNVPVNQVRLDFGDGKSFVTTETAGTIPHTYEGPGFYTATVTAFSGAHSASDTTTIDVAPINTVQVRIDGKPWVDALTTTSSANWSTSVDLSGVPSGPQRIYARYCEPIACVWDYVDVVKIEPPVLFAPSQVSVNEGAGSVTLTASLREASGSTVTATFTTVDGTAKSSSD